MSDPKNEPLVGGRYVVKDGVRTLVEEPTQDHPEGNRARPAEDAAEPAEPANRKPRGSAKGAD